MSAHPSRYSLQLGGACVPLQVVASPADERDVIDHVEVAALEDELNEAKQRLVAACDLETRAREGR